MIIRGFFLAALVGVSMALGCGPPEDPCVAGPARLVECKRVDEEGRAYFAELCSSSPEERCSSDCYADASCEDLATLSNPDDSCYNISNVVFACISRCHDRYPENYQCNTPLVLSFDSAPVHFGKSDRFFDFGIGASVVTDWPSAATPWLALDRNGDGVIDDATELFGSSSPLQAGGRAANGFIPLRELDSDGDGRVTAADKAWASLLVWSDRNGDRVSSHDELASLDATGVTAIDLGYARELRCDARGNCEGERAGFRFREESGAERTGSVVDVYLRLQ